MQKYDLIVGFGCSFMQGGGFENKLRLIDMPNCPIPDLHLNLNGHKLIAEKIYNKIKNT